jgi:cathepsin A (carboxypeptidase C)
MPVVRDIDAYLNRQDVKKLIGVDSYFDSRNMTNPAMKVNSHFVESLDTLRSSYHYVASLLEHGIKVLIYVGKTDWICNHLANEKWVMDLDWSGKEGFHHAKKEDWSAGPKALSKPGEIRSHGGLTYMTIDGAGHMVRYPTCSLVYEHLAQRDHRFRTISQRRRCGWLTSGSKATCNSLTACIPTSLSA